MYAPWMGGHASWLEVSDTRVCSCNSGSYHAGTQASYSLPTLCVIFKIIGQTNALILIFSIGLVATRWRLWPHSGVSLLGPVTWDSTSRWSHSSHILGSSPAKAVGMAARAREVEV